MDKSEIRELYLSKRKNLDEQEFEELTERIATWLFKLPFSSVKNLHLFYPIAGKREFNTLLLKDWLCVHHPQIRLVLSKSNLENHTLEHFEWNQHSRLALNKWGITEPLGGRKVFPEELDMILIPLLAFDKAGNRVGYGKGFYDRFLKECRPEATKVGVSFFEPLDEMIETNEFDIPLDMAVTPSGIFNFSSDRKSSI